MAPSGGTTAKRRSGPAPGGKKAAEEQPLDRKSAIVQALHRCIREKGYAFTSLTDIALKAAMSPSHIRYYFPDKAAILRHYFESLCDDLLAEIASIPFDDPEEWLRKFARFYIGNPRISQAGLSVVVEIFGVAMHDAEMQATKNRFDDDMRSVLRRYFEHAGCAKGLTPAIAAELTRAIDIGLKYSAAFFENQPDELEGMFLKGVRNLAGAAPRG